MADDVQAATAAETTEPTYTREALAASKKYREHCDIIMVTLEPDKQYTIAEVDAEIKKILAQPVQEKINGKE